MSAEVTVVIATRDRPEMLREAIASVRCQDGVQGIEVIVVYDQDEPDFSLAHDEDGFRIRVIRNTRKPGLAGARNSGIQEAVGQFVAFCDDDDYWLPGKLQAQVTAMQSRPDSPLSSCGILVEYDGEWHERILQRSEVTFADLLRDRLTELHPSTFFFRAAALKDIGLVSEEVPGGFGEDYELLLRTARQGPILTVPAAYTVVRWHKSSFFFRRWAMMSEGLQHVLAVHPEIRGDRRGNARIQGQIAFAEASRGGRRQALRAMTSAGKSFPLEPRIYLAGLVAIGLLKPGTVMTTLHRFGRGI